jgi:hypothetical protein
MVAARLADVDLLVRAGGGTEAVGPGAVVVSALLAGLAGWALLALLERFTSRARTVWLVVAAVVLLLSLAGPLGAGADAATTAVLVGMHLAVGAVLIPGLAVNACTC